MTAIYGKTAIAGYEQVFAHVSSHFIPFLLEAGRVTSGRGGSKPFTTKALREFLGVSLLGKAKDAMPFVVAQN